MESKSSTYVSEETETPATDEEGTGEAAAVADGEMADKEGEGKEELEADGDAVAGKEAGEQEKSENAAMARREKFESEMSTGPLIRNENKAYAAFLVWAKQGSSSFSLFFLF